MQGWIHHTHAFDVVVAYSLCAIAVGGLALHVWSGKHQRLKETRPSELDSATDPDDDEMQ